METLGKTTTTDLPSAAGPGFGTWKCKKPRKKIIFICVIGFFFVFTSRLYKWTSIWEQFKTPHNELTVDEVIFALPWHPSASNFTSFMNSSSAQHSVVRLEQPRAKYCVGETLTVLVEMRNKAGQPKAYGGDFLLARIHSPKLQAFASGAVTDLLNGSYRVHFRLFWSGEVHISVRLIHSSEAVRLLQREWMHGYNRVVHFGTFIKGKKKEKTQCVLRPSSNKPLCEYRRKENGEYYACYRPPTLPCDSLTMMKSRVTSDHYTKEEFQLLTRSNTGILLRNSLSPVTVIDCPDAAHRPTEKCVAGTNSPFPGGYFYLNRWSSSFCQIGPFLSEDAITRCLTGKTLYMLGDSTICQWILYLEQKLKGLRYIKKERGHSFLAADVQNNITVRWVVHSHPWIGSNTVNITKSVTIPEVLDSISVDGGQEDVIVVIGIGQHLRPYPIEVYIRRLRSIRWAILRLYARNPQANAVIKLENTRELDSKMTQFSNWYGYMHNWAQRKVFEDMQVALVDAWDMTVAANTFAIHPKESIVSNGVAMALSFFCH